MGKNNGGKSTTTTSLARRVWNHDNTSILMVLVGMLIVVIFVEWLIKGQVNFISGMNISNVLLQVSVTGISWRLACRLS